MLQTRWTLVVASLLGATVRQARADGLSFYWWFDGQNDYTLNSCNSLQLNFTPNPNASSPAVPPYYLLAYTAGNIPDRFLATSGDPFTWQVAYPAGTQMLLSFIDSAGNSGGVGPLYTVIGGSVNCAMYGQASTPLSFSLNPAAQPSTCQSIALTPSGGTPPYTLTYAVTADVAYNTTFSNSSISFKNTLSGGGTFMAVLSDSAGSYANSSQLIYSGGGSDTSCFVAGNPTGTDTPKSGGTNTPKGSEGEGQEPTAPHGIGKYKVVIGGLAAVVAALMLGVIWFFWRKKRKSAGSFAAVGNMRNSAPHSPSDQPSSYDGHLGPEKRGTLSPSGTVGGGGGMWRPESPFDYPGFAAAPVRFRVTNPDDDGRSERSVGTTGRTRSGTVTTEDYARRSRAGAGQRRSLIDTDHNALYPPTSYTHLTSNGSDSPTSGEAGASPTRPRQGSTPSLIGSEVSTEGDLNGGGTFLSSASSTDDHYATIPASSAGRFASSSNNTTPRVSNSHALNTGADIRRQRSLTPTSTSGYRSGVSESEGYETETSYAYQDESDEDPWAPPEARRGPHSMTRTDSYHSTSNAYGSPFADTQKPAQSSYR